mgnify:CR=1 FL=1
MSIAVISVLCVALSSSAVAADSGDESIDGSSRPALSWASVEAAYGVLAESGASSEVTTRWLWHRRFVVATGLLMAGYPNGCRIYSPPCRRTIAPSVAVGAWSGGRIGQAGLEVGAVGGYLRKVYREQDPPPGRGQRILSTSGGFVGMRLNVRVRFAITRQFAVGAKLPLIPMFEFIDGPGLDADPFQLRYGTFVTLTAGADLVPEQE